jgi:hypothetical protein
MARKEISQEDVWCACDALLLDGARPTGERVKDKLSLKSITGIAPHIESWFMDLGTRLKTAAETAPAPAPPAVPPGPLLQAAQAFWETAQTEARHDIEQRVRNVTAAAADALKSEKRRAALAENSLVAATTKIEALETELSSRNAALRDLTLARAAAERNVEAAKKQVEELEIKLAARETELNNVRNAAKRHVTMAVQRVTETEARAQAEIGSLQRRLASMMADPAKP